MCKATVSTALRSDVEADLELLPSVMRAVGFARWDRVRTGRNTWQLMSCERLASKTSTLDSCKVEREVSTLNVHAYAQDGTHLAAPSKESHLQGSSGPEQHHRRCQTVDVRPLV